MTQLLRGFVAGVFLVAGASVAAAQSGQAAQAGQHDQHAGAPPDRIGSAHVDFRTSCAPAVKADFNRAVALLHSFWFPEARAAFQDVAKKDATCAMAHWGIALTYWGNPFGGVRTAALIEQGQAAIAIGQKTGTPTPRERAYVDAVAGLFSSADPGTQRARVLAYEAAMEKIARENPTDVEAQIFWALAVNQTALPTDKTYAQNLKAAGILEPLFTKMPDHPGLAHYIIHAYDVPALAPKALPARAPVCVARAGGAARAAHAVAHVHARRRLARFDRDEHGVRRRRARGEVVRRRAACARLSDLRLPADRARRRRAGRDRTRAPGRQHRRRRRSRRGGRRRVRLGRDARALRARAPPVGGGGAVAGAAGQHAVHTGHHALRPRDRPRAQRQSDGGAGANWPRSMRSRERLIAGKDPYWPEQLQIMRNAGEAWMHFAEGRRDAAIAQMSATADAEDATDKSPISPGPLAPAREQLGYMLLEAGQAKPALAAFEAVMKKEPNRFLAIYGAAQASEALKQTAAAQKYYRQLTTMCKDAPAGRKELEDARQKAR